MPNTTITCAYQASALATGVNPLAAALFAAPIDFTLPNTWGLLVTNDVLTKVGQSCSRTFTLKMVPTTADAAGTASLGAAGAVKSIARTAAGGLYAKPPVVTLTGKNTSPASAAPVMQVGGGVVISGGSSYVSPVAHLSGGSLAVGGIPLVVTFTVAFGAITAVNVNANNGPYVTPPVLAITDAGGGSGAEIILGLSLASFVVTSPGFGYQVPPTVVVTPLFKQMVPDSSGNVEQASTMRGWMNKVLSQATTTVVQEIDPAVS
jgi:hypothetical protein